MNRLALAEGAIEVEMLGNGHGGSHLGVVAGRLSTRTPLTAASLVCGVKYGYCRVLPTI